MKRSANRSLVPRRSALALGESFQSRSSSGLRKKSALGVDPVIPAALDGLKVKTQLAGRPVEVTYRIKAKGCGPLAVSVNGVNLDFVREHNPYRSGAVRIPMDAIVAGLKGKTDQLEVSLG